MESDIENPSLSQREVLLARQQKSGKMFLVLQGNFYRAYNEAAFAVHRVTGYRVFKKVTVSGEVYYQLGFNLKQIDDVLAKIEQKGGQVTRFDQAGTQFAFTGLDGSVDEQLLSESRQKPKQQKSPALSMSETDFHAPSLLQALAAEIVAKMEDGYKLQIGLVR
ncbi:MAG: hypothetical protein U0K49_02385 [Segatella copri]|nr:hypothetical protein [Segatella copri]